MLTIFQLTKSSSNFYVSKSGRSHISTGTIVGSTLLAAQFFSFGYNKGTISLFDVEYDKVV